MKAFNEAHEAIIDYCLTPTRKAEEGEVIPHSKVVDQASVYYQHKPDEYVKISLSKSMILELAAHINRIESEKVDMPYTELPF